VVERLDPAAVQADVVRAPAGAERLTAGGEFTDEFGEVLVVGVAAGFSAQQRDRGGERTVVVGVVVGRAGVEKVEAGAP